MNEDQFSAMLAIIVPPIIEQITKNSTVQKIFCGIHRLRHQHFKAAHSHRHARFLGAEDELGLVGVVHHIHHSFKVRHGGNVQIAHAYIGVHARRGGVYHDLRPAGNGLGIAQLALFRVRMAADGEHH